VARWKREDHAGVPERVVRYRPKLHGQGDTGIRQWKAEAMTWLDENPGRALPCGDGLGVLRETTRLLMDEWGF
jgi:hypothetical protein